MLSFSKLVNVYNNVKSNVNNFQSVVTFRLKNGDVAFFTCQSVFSVFDGDNNRAVESKRKRKTLRKTSTLDTVTRKNMNLAVY